MHEVISMSYSAVSFIHLHLTKYAGRVKYTVLCKERKGIHVKFPVFTKEMHCNLYMLFYVNTVLFVWWLL